VLTTDVSKFLGHRNLSTTTRYLNTISRRLRVALMRVEQARAQSGRDSGRSVPRRRRRSVVHAYQVTGFLVLIDKKNQVHDIIHVHPRRVRQAVKNLCSRWREQLRWPTAEPLAENAGNRVLRTFD
jgi:hypothetical protein